MHHTKSLILGLLCLAVPDIRAQEHYVRPEDPQVLEKLAWWRDQKLGLILHWGTYSQWGIVESWSLCSEDEPWCRRPIDDYGEYKRRYEALKGSFDPVRFDPDRWAEAARDAGMRYVVFTTKHHDGFCMFDTRLTTYRITDPGCPFHHDPRADVTREVFRAFRTRGLGIGAYFSKPDWHSDTYWWRRFATPDRHVNYDPARYPERWKAFQDFTHGQIEELMTGYGQVDILWLDGAWVRPFANMPDEYVAWAKKDTRDQDVDMDRIGAMARRHQPGILVVDRWVSGRWENYLTPEQKVPDTALEAPWESCVTMGRSWSYTPDDRMKSVRELVHLLIGVVAKGGNLLLGVGVDAQGELPPDAYERMRGLGAWLDVNGPAIYGTRPVEPYVQGRVAYARAKDRTIAAILSLDDAEELPAVLTLHAHRPNDGSPLYLLGHPDELTWSPVGQHGCRIELPEALRKAMRGRPACSFWLGER
ncbi:MAG: alpha-L-fucosidase [Planctomycetes bacterium]|nr:alpha-L-fucosidase [Planctomycetota bacterium]